ncbi:MAG: STAS/SEC14 domain-containing protein [bacterium]|nr:STAS/SEC14 domain-containing protein [bacterium]
MPYQLSWYKPETILYLKLEGQLSMDELETANQEVMGILDSLRARVNILIDVTHFSATHQTTGLLRDTQQYMNHHKIDSAYIVTDNKLMRLITLMAFSISRAKVIQFATMDVAESRIERLSSGKYGSQV